MKKLILLMLLFFGGLSFNTSYAADGYNLTVNQIINFDSTQKKTGLEGNTISIYRKDKETGKLVFVEKAVTDANGKVVFKNLPEGEYVIKGDKNDKYSVIETPVIIKGGNKSVSSKSTGNTDTDVDVPVREKEKEREKRPKKDYNKEPKKDKEKEKEKKPGKNVLIPRTGQIEIFIYTLGGIALFLLGFFIYRRDRKNEKR